NYALFPHLDVFENIAFGLRSRKKPDREINEKVAQILALVQLDAFKTRAPHQLSGGQKQRVALARALVNEPLLLLLDEPMSALDAKLRHELQFELRRIQRNSNTTFILVTHDQDEALTVSDRIYVMNNGRIEQSGTPTDIYERPTSRFVAQFLGSANLIQAHRNGSACVHTDLGDLALSHQPEWKAGTVMIRPERIRICDGPAAVNGLSVTIQDAIYRGDHCELLVSPGDLRIRTAPGNGFVPSNKLSIQLPPEFLEVLRD
ncbi:MAG: ABC transporter ATP-binding protein, partial [bacterium]|nr:ABC transporter ATP-binding protein [bacterium]